MVEKLKSNTAELREMCEEAQYFSLSSLQKHLSALMIIHIAKAQAASRSYPRLAMVVVTTGKRGCVPVEALRLLKDAGFELESPSIQQNQNVITGGIETLCFASSKPALSESAANRLRDELLKIERAGTGTSSSCTPCHGGTDCRFSFI